MEATIRTCVAQAGETLGQAGIPPAEAALDARLLARFVLDWNDTRFLTGSNEPAMPSFTAAYQKVIERRARREPFAYITRRKEFWGLDFEVSPAVLIPRPETEAIVEAVLARSEREAPISIADVGTGSGCLAVALAHERPYAAIVATDVSADAISIARANAVHHRVDDRVRCVEADLLGEVETSFDFVVSNPPYVPRYEQASLQPEVRDYEPAVALFADAGGLAVIRRLVDQATSRLKDDGFLIFEFGFGQAEAVRILLASTRAFDEIALVEDLQKIPRTAIARKRG